MSARRCSIRQGSSTILTSSHTVGRAPLSDIRERLGNLRNTTAGRSNTSGKPSVDIWQKSVNATESAESLDVDALLARRARRKALRESTTRNISIEAPLHDVFTPEVSESQQGVSRAVPGSPQANTSTATPRLLSPLPESTAQKNKNKAVLYETGFKLKSAEERIDHLMKEMDELRMFATVSAQFQNEAEEERRNLIKVTQQTEQTAIIESLKAQNRQLLNENSSLQSTLETYRSQISSHEIQTDAKLREAGQSYRSLQSHLAAKETANNELQRHFDEFKEFMENKLSVSEKNSKSLQTELIAKENKIINLSENGDKLKQLLDKATRESEQNYESLQTDLDAKECENRELREQYNELKRELEMTKRESEQKYENLQENLHAKDIENRKLQEQCNKLERELVNKIKISEEQFDSLQEDLDMRKDENLMLREQFNELKQELENLTREKDQKVHSLQADLDAQETMNIKLQKRCDQLKQALDNATRESEHNYGNLQTDLETSKSENTMLRKLCDDLKQELEKLQRESEQNCNSLQADLEASERENDELARAIEEIEEQNSAIEGMVDAYEKELHELKSANCKLEGEKDAIVSKLASKDVAYQAVKQECSEKMLEMKDRYSELEELYRRSKIEIDQLRSSLLLAQNKVRELTKEINHLSSENKRLCDDQSSRKATMESFNGKKVENSETSLSASQRVFGIADEGSISGSFSRERIETDALQSYMKHRQSHLRR